MRKLLIFLFAVSLLTACKNNKDDRRSGRDRERERDDYRSRDEEKEGDKRNTDYKDDKESRDSYDDESRNDEPQPKDEEQNKRDDDFNAGWPQHEKDAFVRECVPSAMKKGQSRSVSQSYCNCMLEKLEALYPDINDAARLSESELKSVMSRYADGCMNQ